MTDLDRRLQEIASQDWERFTNMVGEDAVIGAKICLLRGEHKSYNQIVIRLHITERQARYGCTKCPTVSVGLNGTQ